LPILLCFSFLSFSLSQSLSSFSASLPGPNVSINPIKGAPLVCPVDPIETQLVPQAKEEETSEKRKINDEKLFEKTKTVTLLSACVV
jgi:hypothetical protein